MTELKCTAAHCAYNNDCCCCKGEIHVQGSTADTRESTCCGSFDDRTRNCGCNAADMPERKLKVSCDATNCIYNKERMCSANHIDIQGASAHVADKTECATFQMR